MAKFWRATWRRAKYVVPIIAAFILEQIIGWIAGKWADQIAAQPSVKRAAQLTVRGIADRPESILWTAILVTILWIVWKARKEAPAQELAETVSTEVPGVPVLSGLPEREVFVPRPPPRLQDPWSVEILEMLFRRSYGNLLSPDRGWYILVKLRIVNRGFDEPAIVDWKMDVNVGSSYSRTADVVALPENWLIKRLPPGYGAATEEQIERPTLDERTNSDGVYRGRPLTGWVLFELLTHERVGAPYNARFNLRITDALGSHHMASIGPDMYKETATIDVAEQRASAQ